MPLTTVTPARGERRARAARRPAARRRSRRRAPTIVTAGSWSRPTIASRRPPHAEQPTGGRALEVEQAVRIVAPTRAPIPSASQALMPHAVAAGAATAPPRCARRRSASCPARSAIVRASRITRSRPRPLSPVANPASASNPLDRDRRARSPRRRARRWRGRRRSAPLALARGEHPVAHVGRALARLGERASGRAGRRARDVDPVGERAGELRLVRRGPPSDRRCSRPTADRGRTGTGSRRRSAETGRAARPRTGPASIAHRAVLERLAQRLERRRGRTRAARRGTGRRDGRASPRPARGGLPPPTSPAVEIV